MFSTPGESIHPPPPPPPVNGLYLKPLAVRLHLQNHARVRFGEGVSVWDSPTGHSELHFGEARRADEAQRGLCRLVDVAHRELHSHPLRGEREKEKQMCQCHFRTRQTDRQITPAHTWDLVTQLESDDIGEGETANWIRFGHFHWGAYSLLFALKNRTYPYTEYWTGKAKLGVKTKKKQNKFEKHSCHKMLKSHSFKRCENMSKWQGVN